jgi:hypothetical protein
MGTKAKEREREREREGLAWWCTSVTPTMWVAQLGGL